MEKMLNRPQNREVIDGVIVVHTGKYVRTRRNGRFDPPVEVLEIYDENGNIFIGNHDDMEHAEFEVAFYQKHGIDAVIGHRAPCNSHNGVFPNPYEYMVGVYLVKTPDLQQKLATISIEENKEFLKEYGQLSKKIARREAKSLEARGKMLSFYEYAFENSPSNDED